MNFGFHVIIPARFHSTRLPAKLLMDIHGKTIIERVYHQALLARPLSVVIATDHEEIAQVARSFGGRVVMTKTTHQTGTDRLAEVISKGTYSADDVIVNVQGDEPFIHPALIRQVAESLTRTAAPVSTLCWPIENIQQFKNPNVVKVVRTKDQYALYFSRSPIPAHRDDPGSFALTYRHIGLYAYRASFLMDYVNWPVCELEVHEALEQLRVLWSGVAIKVEKACVEPLQDINTIEDLALARQVVF